MKKGLMRIAIILVMIFITTGCSSNLERVTYSEFEDMIKEEKTFILEVSQDNCSHCEEFTPRFKTILDKYDIKAYNLNISYISDSDYNKFSSKYNFEGTPTTMFFKRGKELTNSRIDGALPDKNVLSVLKRQGYIKE